MRYFGGVRRSLCAFVIASVWWLTSPACAQEEDDGPSLGEAIIEFADALEEARNTELPEVVAFTEGQLKRTLEATRELQSLELAQAPTMAMDASAFPRVAESLVADAQARAVLRFQRLTASEYVSVLYSVGVAMQAVLSDPGEMQAEWQAIQEMPAQDRAMLEPLMGPLVKMLEQILTQPPGNIELARQYAAEIESVVGED